jgi:hypothetical protein
MPTPCGPLLAALVLGLAILYCVEQQGGFGAGSGGASFAAGSRGAADAAASAGAAASAAGQREESLEARLERRAAEAKTVGLKRRVVPAAEVKKSAALKPKKASASKQRRAQSGRNAVVSPGAPRLRQHTTHPPRHAPLRARTRAHSPSARLASAPTRQHLPLDITRKPSSENRHWSLASLLKREDKIFLTENIAGGAVETFVVRAPRGSTVTAFVLATADIMGSAYREEVRVMEILPVGLPRKTLVPWNVYGSIPRGRDQASPKEYTPAIVGVTTDAVEFEVSVRHDYRGHGVAAPGLAIFRAEGTAP